jgi:hypothetical protein
MEGLFRHFHFFPGMGWTTQPPAYLEAMLRCTEPTSHLTWQATFVVDDQAGHDLPGVATQNTALIWTQLVAEVTQDLCNDPLYVSRFGIRT